MSDNRRLSAEVIARFQAEQAEWLKRGGFERDAIERAERLRAKEEAEWRERDLEVRLAVEAILEEKAKLADEADRKAKEAAIERLVPHIKPASLLAGRRKLSITDQCVDDIRPFLPKEEQGATFEVIKEAIRRARDRDKQAN